MNLEELFPYSSFREGQRDLTDSVYESCKNGSRLVVEAMSGFGKTAPVLTGAILAAEEDDNRIIYTCRTKRQVFRVMEEIERIQRKTPLSTTYLFAKNDYCLLKEMSRFPVSQESFKWYCSFNVTNNLCSYFMNISLMNKEVNSLVKEFSSSVRSHSKFLDTCRSTHVCPYEVARLAIANSRVVVTTYHYIFDEASRSILLNNGRWTPAETIVVIDEAHNLRDFMRDASTTELSFAEIELAIKDSRELYMERIESSLVEILRSLSDFCAKNTSWYVEKNSLIEKISGSHDATWLPNIAFELSTCSGVAWQSIATGKNLPTSITRVGDFLRALLSSPGLERTVVAKSDRAMFLIDTDTSSRFLGLVRDYKSLVLLSATINPSDLFLRSIGLDERTRIHKVNPNQTFQARTIIDTGVSTRFKMRTSEMFRKLTGKISAICGAVRGGVGIFVPSYSMLESLRPLLLDLGKSRNLLVEARSLGNAESEEIMRSFKSTPGSVLLAVQGGRFSEGEDFPGEQMDASVVVGLSLPPPSPTMYAEYTQSGFGKHDAYLVISLLPALRKAIQSAGRHMRSPDKRGLVFFLDSRFDDREIIEMFPAWLKQDLHEGDFQRQEIEQMVRDFAL
ncbi:MAG: ATP-dependent DNA helicase [Thaumarchaeota archaeon]|nr:ATP-dependent DNA helicase [Nitrososphaerota archaeon]